MKKRSPQAHRCEPPLRLSLQWSHPEQHESIHELYSVMTYVQLMTDSILEMERPKNYCQVLSLRRFSFETSSLLFFFKKKPPPPITQYNEE